MLAQDQSKTLFQLSTELIDRKVETAVIKAISQVVDQIVALRQEMHLEIGELRREMHLEIGGLRREIHQELSDIRLEIRKLDNRLSSVETALSLRNQVRSEIRTRFLDYTFKAGWLVALVAISVSLLHH